MANTDVTLSVPQEPPRKDRSHLAALLAAFVLLAVAYSLIIPIFEGPDEDDHLRYAKFIADHRALPVQEFVNGGGIAGHQGWHPPLYYGLVALAISPLDTTDFEQHFWRNPQATVVGDPACCGRNLYYHTASEDFPFRGTPLAVHVARLLSVLFGAVTVWATYRIVETLLPDASWLALGAAAVVAFNPSFLFASALVSNDAALAAVSALVLLVWVQLLGGQQAPSLQAAARLGGLLGLGVLVKTTALGLIPFSMLVLTRVAWRRRDARYFAAANTALVAALALLTGWWFVRNLVLYGDPIAYRLMTTTAIFPRAGPLTPDELFQISLPQMWRTLWGGPTPGDMAPAVLVLLAITCGLAVAGTAACVVRNWRSPVRDALLILAAWFGFILVAQIQFIRTTIGADQGRYLFPAAPVLALCMVLGLCRFRVPGWVPAAGLFCLALAVPFAYTLPAYARPALLQTGDLARIAHPLKTEFAGQLELLGYDLESRWVKPGDVLRVTLYWRALAPMSESYRVFVHLVGSNDTSAGGMDVIPGRGAFPTVYWQPGDVMCDAVQIPVAANAAPGKYSVEIGLYPVGKPGERLTRETGDDRIVVDAIKVTGLGASYRPQTAVGAAFGERITLAGFDAQRDANALALTLYWTSRGDIDRDYAVFVHVLDGQGNIVAQVDQPPQGGNNPTSLWQADEQIRDPYILSLPSDAVQYRVEIGLYRADTGERLPVRERDSLILDIPGP